MCFKSKLCRAWSAKRKQGKHIKTQEEIDKLILHSYINEQNDTFKILSGTRLWLIEQSIDALLLVSKKKNELHGMRSEMNIHPSL